jgi:hypothetical protein
MNRLCCAIFLGFVLFVGDGINGAQEKPSPGVLTVIDGAGKEIKLKNWRFTNGTRNLNLTDKGKNGSEYLEFREERSTVYQNGILTLVPLTAIRNIDYDAAKKTVTVSLVGPDGKDIVLIGTTKYIGINKIGVQGERDLGDLGVGVVKFQGGDPKNSKHIRGLRFPSPKATPAATGKPATILARDKEKTLHQVSDAIPVYQSKGNILRTIPTLWFKTTVKIELDKIKSLRHVPPENKKQTVNDFEVTLRDGKQHNLILLDKINLDDGKPAQLLGLLGRVPAGYKLFPTHTIAEASWEESKEK